jgi:hypothetical protein
VFYGGGGAGVSNAATEVGGNGGGGNPGVNGTANTGGGGGAWPGTGVAGAGGSGIVSARYLGAQRATGGTVTTSGGYTIHTFTASGSLVFDPHVPIEYLVVGGGGSGGGGVSGNVFPGGGAGGEVKSGVGSAIRGSTLTVTVGAGGAQVTTHVNGNTGATSSVASSTLSASALGGGGGFQPGNGGNVGSFTGGVRNGVQSGGGASYAANGFAATAGGHGADGIASSITGSVVTYGGGGGGSGGNGGAGGGGSGVSSGTAGTANTGGGGGADPNQGATGNAGGSGVVILRIPTTAYSGVHTGSPTVTTDGDYTVVKFTASGTYTP